MKRNRGWAKISVFIGILLCFIVVPAFGAPAKQSVLVWMFQIGADGGRALYDTEIIPKFEQENPDIDLEIVILPWANRDEKMLLAYISGSGPDIVYLNLDFFPKFASKGMLEPLERYYTTQDKRDFFPAAQDALKIDGHTYGFPILQTVVAPVLNVDRYRETGLNPANPPRNWSELESQGAKLTSRSDNPAQAKYGINFWLAAESTNQTYNPFLWSNGGDIFKPDGLSVAWDEPESVEALEFLSNLNRQGYIGGKFLDGNVGIQLCNDAAFGMHLARNGSSFEWEPGVVIGQKKQATYGTLAGLAMFNSSKNKDAAARVMRYMTDTKAMATMVSTWGYVGPRRSIRPSAYGEHAKWFVKYMEAAPFTRHDITHPYIRDVYKYLAPATVKAFQLQETAQAALENSARQANAYLREQMGKK